MNTILEHVTLESETCCTCGTIFAMPQALRRERLTNGGNFFCPNGHSQHYTKPEVQRLQEELHKAQFDLRCSKCETIMERNLRETAERRLNRIKKGTCPCCSRHFTNLQRHMETKHPGFNQPKK